MARREVWHTEIIGTVNGVRMTIMEQELEVVGQKDGSYISAIVKQTLYVTEEERLAYAQSVVDEAAQRMVFM